MYKRKIVIIGIVLLIILALIVGSLIFLNYRIQTYGIPGIAEKKIKYKITISELKDILGEPESESSRSDGSIVLCYAQSLYGQKAETSFVFDDEDRELCQTFSRIKTNPGGAAALYQLIEADLVELYDRGGSFYFKRNGKLGGVAIGVSYFGIYENAAELNIENEDTVLLSTWLN